MMMMILLHSTNRKISVQGANLSNLLLRYHFLQPSDFFICSWISVGALAGSCSRSHGPWLILRHFCYSFLSSYFLSYHASAQLPGASIRPTKDIMPSQSRDACVSVPAFPARTTPLSIIQFISNQTPYNGCSQQYATLGNELSPVKNKNKTESH